MPVKIIDNFSGRLTRQNIGDMNSGLAKYATTFGANPFVNPSNLTWFENPIQIDSGGSVIIDLIVATKTRLESGITYVYAIGNTGRLYKIQVNDPTTYNPNYDNPVCLTTLTTFPPTFHYGTSIQFYGATEKIFVGHDKGITKVNFNGTGETYISPSIGSYTMDVPRPSVNFLGKLYFGNGTNLIEIDSTETITTVAKLTPAFPNGTYVKDLDVSPDGNYLQITVSRTNSPQMDSATQDTNSLTSSDSYRFLWNGTDTGYTSYETYLGLNSTSNITFGPYTYMFGYELGGTALYSNSQKVITLPNSLSPKYGACFSTGNMLGMMTPEYVPNDSLLEGSLICYGQYDFEVPKGMFRLLRFKNSNNDVANIPVCLPVSNIFYGQTQLGYAGNLVGASKLYFSTLSTFNGFTYFGFYKFNFLPTGTETAINGVYETQQETVLKLYHSIVSKKFKVNEVRFYVEPLTDANQSFQIDLIGSDGNPISGGTQTFTGGTGQDVFKYTPQAAPTYSLGIRITNLGTVNWVGVKMEIEYEEFGTL